MKCSRTIFLLSVAVILPIVMSAVSGEKIDTLRRTDDIAVVVNAKNDASALSVSDLRKILLGERKFWKGSEPVQLVLRQPGAPERDKVIELLLKMDDAQFTRYWRDMVFRGEALGEPLSVPSNGLASEYVVDMPGGITFVLGKNLRPDLKVLKINGKLPGEPGYALK